MDSTWVPVVDISHAQGAIDFRKMKAAGVQGVIIRASNGVHVDDRHAEYYAGARAAGYADQDLCHFAFVNPKAGTGAQCAVVFVDQVRKIVGHLHVGLMLDVEQYINEYPNPGTVTIFGPTFARYIREELSTIRTEAPEARPFGYTNRSFWNGPAGPGSYVQWVGDAQLAAELDWIVARYPAYSDADYARLGYPPAPEHWWEWATRAQPHGPLPPIGGTGSGWQFAGGFDRQGPVYGCSSLHLDLDLIHPDAWARWTGRTFHPQPVPQPVGDHDMDMVLLLPTDQPDPKTRFYATVTARGAVVRCEWTGDGNLGKVQDRIAARRALGMADFSCTMASFVNASLDGPVPPGFTAEMFANTDEIRARTAPLPPPPAAVDLEARAEIADVGALLDKTRAGLKASGS